jgi:hypothetical protein
MKKQVTAVQYLEQQIKIWGLVIDTVSLQEAIQKAKHFEQQQLINAFNYKYVNLKKDVNEYLKETYTQSSE